MSDSGKIGEGAIGRDPWSEGYETKSGSWEYHLGSILRHVERPLGAEGSARYWRIEQATDFSAARRIGGGESPDITTFREVEGEALLNRVSHELEAERD